MIFKRGARRGAAGPVEVNLAPLLDMVFILLIFFLVTSTLAQDTALELTRPEAASAETMDGPIFQVAIDAGGRVRLAGREAELPDLGDVRLHVARFLAENPEGSVLVVADAAVPTGLVVRVMDGCRLAGAKRLALAAREPQ